MRLIGDVHGKIGQYINIASPAQYSLQVGDMGFNYDKINLDSSKHKFVPGNHDNYDLLPNEYSLMDYGVWSTDVDIFYIRGAWSIDGPGCPWDQGKSMGRSRIQGVDWWDNEECDVKTLEAAIELYSQIQPRIVVTHEAPLSAVQWMHDNKYIPQRFPVIKTRTSQALQIMLEIHRPSSWYFGHYHNNAEFKLGTGYDKCIFRCLNELCYVDIS